MTQSTIALIIFAVILILFAWGRFHIGVTAVLGAIAMAVFGVIPYKDAFSYFGQESTVIMIAGMMVVGNAMFVSGFSSVIGKKIAGIKGIGQNERLLLLVVMTVIVIISGFLANAATLAMFLPLVASVAAKSNGKITKKNTFMAMAMAALVGGNMTLVGSTPQLAVQGLLEEAGMQTMSFFTLLPAALPSFIILLIYFGTFGYKLQKKTFDFPEVQEEVETSADEEQEYSKVKIWICGIVFVGMIICFAFKIFSYGTVAMLGASICIMTGCISMKQALKMMDWTSIVVLGGCLGFAAGLKESGAITVIAEAALGLIGGANASPWVLAIAIGVLCCVLSNFMSNTAVATIMATFGIESATIIGVSPFSLALIAVVCSNLAFSTPIGCTPMTMSLQGGYRFKDYTIVGGVYNVLALIATVVVTPLVYGF